MQQINSNLLGNKTALNDFDKQFNQLPIYSDFSASDSKVQEELIQNYVSPLNVDKMIFTKE